MSVSIDKNTKVMVQGIRVCCLFHTKQMLDYGTIVAGVTPGKGDT